MAGNGMRSHGFHADRAPDTARNIKPRPGEGAVALAMEDLANQDPVAVARQYLENALQSEALPSLTLPTPNEETSFALAGVDESRYKNTRTVKLRQTLNGIEVAGSLVSVELDAASELVCLDTTLGHPQDVTSVPTLAAEDALETIHRRANVLESSSPRLSYYYQTDAERWHLAYVVQDVFCANEVYSDVPMPFVDLVIDGHEGRLIDVLPRGCAAVVTALDANNRPRQIQTAFDTVTAGQQLHDSNLNVHTKDFAFQDIGASFNNLPGGYVKAPPLPWNVMAVSAHANAELVATFLATVLGRRGLDGRGGPLVASINCTWAAMGSNGRNWPNSFWIKDQALFGQRQLGTNTRSFAAALDMVAHEFFHGVTQYTSRLDMKGQTGALNESYSDIFATFVANGMRPDWNVWTWQIGADTGEPVRDLSRPGEFGHPEHMSQYQNLPLGNDFGGIHKNCGIHNKAAFNIMTARDPQGRFLFTPKLMAQTFYHALLAPLPPTALFSDSRRIVEHQARTILRGDPQINLKLNAISQGCAKVGIV